ncbi:hypothetical protein [Flexivirga alba]|uniref:Uncharacterized protein n=1 Tax=Flexivirga alba TaxID=702742 RepID=A0ABW2AIT4_9MICO
MAERLRRSEDGLSVAALIRCVVAITVAVLVEASADGSATAASDPVVIAQAAAMASSRLVGGREMLHEVLLSGQKRPNGVDRLLGE